jgi:DnaJ-class molecular chaperone
MDDCLVRLHTTMAATEIVLAELDARLGPPCECQECDGHGWQPKAGDIRPCPTCAGKGYLGDI